MTATAVPFTLAAGNVVTAGVTTSTTRTALVGYVAGRSVVLNNLSYSEIYVVFGDSSVVATATGADRGYCIKSREEKVVTPAGNGITHVAHIGSASGDLQIIAGAGA